MRGSPMRPSRIARVASACVVEKRNSVPSMWTMPAASAASSIARASPAFFANGFSHSTCVPAAMDCRTMPACVCGGVATATRSTFGSASASDRDA